MKKRKVRCDRIHVLYLIENIVTNDTYVGLTRRVGRATIKSTKLRLKQHISRALVGKHSFPICLSIREHGPEKFRIRPIELVRGKAEAHQRERELIREMSPTLNKA